MEELQLPNAFFPSSLSFLLFSAFFPQEKGVGV